MEIDPFTAPISLAEQERYAKLTPVEQLESIEICSGEIAFTRIRAYLHLSYRCYAQQFKEAPVYFFFYNEKGEETLTGSGHVGRGKDLDGVCYRLFETQSFAELPDRIWVEVRDAYDTPIGRIECRLEEISASEYGAEEFEDVLAW